MSDSDFDVGPPYGFYLRHNGTCPKNLVQCSSQSQWKDDYGEWFNCCPKGTVCVDNTCCPTDSGCKMAVKSDPHCANNQTWDLYYHEGWFCCMHGTIGYLNSGLYVGNTKTTGVACAEHWMHGEEYDVLVATAKGTPSSSATPTPTVANTDNTTDSKSDSWPSGNNAGAIAGGVVGGCAGLALIIAFVWFLIGHRRKRIQPASAVPVGVDSTVPHHEYKGTHVELANSHGRLELPDNHGWRELSGSPNQMAHELPADTSR
ncbi:hypothetical protein P885DRAFT_72157 [Corynascus similis CBS 632.67]